MTTLETIKTEFQQLQAKYQPTALKYCSLVLPNAYKYGKLCPWLKLIDKEIVEVSDYAKKAPYGSATRYYIQVDPTHIDALKAEGWRLINRANGELVK